MARKREGSSGRGCSVHRLGYAWNRMLSEASSRLVKVKKGGAEGCVSLCRLTALTFLKKVSSASILSHQPSKASIG